MRLRTRWALPSLSLKYSPLKGTILVARASPASSLTLSHWSPAVLTM